MFYQYFGKEWMQLIFDSESWEGKKQAWLEWRNMQYNKQTSRESKKFSFISVLESLMKDDTDTGSECSSSDVSSSSSASPGSSAS